MNTFLTVCTVIGILAVGTAASFVITFAYFVVAMSATEAVWRWQTRHLRAKREASK